MSLLQQIKQQRERRIDVGPENFRAELEVVDGVPQRSGGSQSHSHVFVGAQESQRAFVEGRPQTGRQFYARPATYQPSHSPSDHPVVVVLQFQFLR